MRHMVFQLTGRFQNHRPTIEEVIDRFKGGHFNRYRPEDITNAHAPEEHLRNKDAWAPIQGLKHPFHLEIGECTIIPDWGPENYLGVKRVE